MTVDPKLIQVNKNSDAYPRDTCSIVYTVQILGKKWSVHIISELLLERELMFSELKKRLVSGTNEGISSRVLTDKLVALEEIGIVSRNERDNRVYYSLTESGMEFKIIFQVLKGWGIKHGGVQQKLCKSYTCIHNSVRHIDLDKLDDLIERNPDLLG